MARVAQRKLADLERQYAALQTKLEGAVCVCVC
jgi:hypothetical protein